MPESGGYLPLGLWVYLPNECRRCGVYREIVPHHHHHVEGKVVEHLAKLNTPLCHKLPTGEAIISPGEPILMAR
jgi:hypothetical protein